MRLNFETLETRNLAGKLWGTEDPLGVQALAAALYQPPPVAGDKIQIQIAKVEYGAGFLDSDRTEVDSLIYRYPDGDPEGTVTLFGKIGVNQAVLYGSKFIFNNSSATIDDKNATDFANTSTALYSELFINGSVTASDNTLLHTPTASQLWVGMPSFVNGNWTAAQTDSIGIYSQDRDSWYVTTYTNASNGWPTAGIGNIASVKLQFQDWSQFGAPWVTLGVDSLLPHETGLFQQEVWVPRNYQVFIGGQDTFFGSWVIYNSQQSVSRNFTLAVPSLP